MPDKKIVIWSPTAQAELRAPQRQAMRGNGDSHSRGDRNRDFSECRLWHECQAGPDRRNKQRSRLQIRSARTFTTGRSTALSARVAVDVSVVAARTSVQTATEVSSLLADTRRFEPFNRHLLSSVASAVNSFRLDSSSGVNGNISAGTPESTYLRWIFRYSPSILY